MRGSPTSSALLLVHGVIARRLQGYAPQIEHIRSPDKGSMRCLDRAKAVLLRIMLRRWRSIKGELARPASRILMENAGKNAYTFPRQNRLARVSGTLDPASLPKRPQGLPPPRPEPQASLRFGRHEQGHPVDVPPQRRIWLR